MSYYTEPNYSRTKTKVELDLSDYATQSDKKTLKKLL